ncbi:hypothetical protein V5F34_12910 [Xanthobacter autotrophicus]|jgi:hypothetical protein|uniref:Uncharacterized protein n=1 Tax=Xanthobacter autotrophicus TaxID=280 RepID=A0A6C1KSR1_XANAU|nr:hypothetical protein [Xanthobacter autotrophicus]TLX41783.1 hypothetical protein FBQ73_16845 [Xanthobacter autotrophicus]
MSEPRNAPTSGSWPASASPHGYDRAEFRPGESRRDYPRRPRAPDEEQRLLREAEAAFGGTDRRLDIDIDLAGSDGEGDREPDGNERPSERPSRLYRE